MSWVELEHLGFLGVRGPDALPFLQGQLTNDLRAVTPDRAVRSAVASPQGRVLAIVDVLAAGDTFLLVLPRTETALLRERLGRYVLRARAELHDESEAWRALGALDRAAVETLGRTLGTTLFQPGAVARGDGLLALAIDALPRAALFGPRAALDGFARTLPAERALLERWRLADIRAGLPGIAPQTRELFVPQMLNLDLIDALSFTKGCYTGQEIVARTQHRGRIKRRMLRARVGSAAPSSPGTAIYARGAVTGHVVSSAPDERGEQELLAVVSIADAAQPLTLGASDGPQLMRLPLPYSVAELAGDAFAP